MNRNWSAYEWITDLFLYFFCLFDLSGLCTCGHEMWFACICWHVMFKYRCCFFYLSTERNDQTEQEERREIKQRLNRKVSSSLSEKERKSHQLLISGQINWSLSSPSTWQTQFPWGTVVTHGNRKLIITYKQTSQILSQTSSYTIAHRNLSMQTNPQYLTEA